MRDKAVGGQPVQMVAKKTNTTKNKINYGNTENCNGD